MAQATISGLLEIGAVNNGKVTTQAATVAASETDKTSSTARHNTWSTSVLNVSASEDLGGGLRATAVMISGVGDGFAARERTLALSGGFGTVRMGRFVPAAANGFHGFSGAGSATLAGSVYSMSTAGTTVTTHSNAANFERQDNVVQYTSPNFNGLTVNVAYANDSRDRSDAARVGKDQGTQTSLHLGYASGPLSVGVGMNNRTSKTEAALAAANTAFVNVDNAAVNRAETKSSLNWIGASYDLGVARVMATQVKRDAKNTLPGGAKTTDATVNAIGVAVPMGAITLRASTYRGKDKRAAGNTDDMKLSGHQVSVTYALSKRTSVIAAMGENKVTRDGAAALATASRKVQANTLALNHTF
jgi:predicted porin